MLGSLGAQDRGSGNWVCKLNSKPGASVLCKASMLNVQNKGCGKDSLKLGESTKTHPVHSVFELNLSLVIICLHCTFSGWQHFYNQLLPAT